MQRCEEVNKKRLISLQCNFMTLYDFMTSWWLSGKEPACQCRSQELDPCVGKILWRRDWLPTPVFMPGICPSDRGDWWPTVYWVAKESDTTEGLSTQCFSLYLCIYFQLTFLKLKVHFLCFLVFIVLLSVLSPTIYYKKIPNIQLVEHVF